MQPSTESPFRHGVVLFTSDRGITPAAAARAAEDRGFDTFYVPEHTHIPVRRDAAHPGRVTRRCPTTATPGPSTRGSRSRPPPQ